MPEAEKYYQGIAPVFLINAKLDLNEQQFGRARESLTRFVQVNPDDAEAHYLIGETYRRQNPAGPDFSSSISAYERALAVDSGYADAHKEIGMAYRIQRENDKAAAAFKRYLELAADAPDAGIIRGYLEGLQ